MHSQLAFLNRTARTGLAVLVLAALALSFSARPAHAATITISDQASCQAAGGLWDGFSQECNFSNPYTVNTGDTLQLNVDTVFFSSLTNNGTLNVSQSAFVTASGNATNSGTINLNDRLRFRNTIDNASTGSINVNNFGLLELFGGVPVLNNDGVVTITSGGELFNDGTVNNHNLIEVACGGSLSGTGTYTGNPVQTPSDCTPPGVTVNQAASQADPTNTSPINFTAVFSEPVFDFTDADVALSGTAGATTAVVTGGPTTFNIAVSGMTTGGTVSAAIPAGAATDAAGNGNTASTSTDNSVTFGFDVADDDQDGVPNDEDECPDSDLSATVVIDGCNSGAENDLFTDGCTISDLVTNCLEDSSTRIRALLCTTRLTKDLRHDGALSVREAIGILACTVRSLFPDDD